MTDPVCSQHDPHPTERPSYAHTFAHLLLDTAKTLSRGSQRHVQHFHSDAGFAHMQRQLGYLLDALWLTDGAPRPTPRATEYAQVLVTVTRFLTHTADQPDGIGPQTLHVELLAFQLYLLRLLRETGGFEDLLERYDIDHEECLAELRGVPAYRS